jgi:hypothetical protein
VWLAVTSSHSLVFAKIDVGFSCPVHLEDYLMSLLVSDPIALKELYVQFLCKVRIGRQSEEVERPSTTPHSKEAHDDEQIDSDLQQDSVPRFKYT